MGLLVEDEMIDISDRNMLMLEFKSKETRNCDCIMGQGMCVRQQRPYATIST